MWPPASGFFPGPKKFLFVPGKIPEIPNGISYKILTFYLFYIFFPERGPPKTPQKLGHFEHKMPMTTPLQNTYPPLARQPSVRHEVSMALLDPCDPNNEMKPLIRNKRHFLDEIEPDWPF